MALLQMINAARERKRLADQAAEEAKRAQEMEQFQQRVVSTLGETFVQDMDAQMAHDGSPHIAATFNGQTFKIGLSRNTDGSRSWHVNQHRVFDMGRAPEQQGAIDQLVLTIAQLADEPESQPETTTPTVRLEEPTTEE